MILLLLRSRAGQQGYVAPGEETVEVSVKNRSKEPKTIIVREHVWRWSNWKIEDPTMEFEKEDVNTIRFTVPLKPNEEKTITYTAHYTW